MGKDKIVLIKRNDTKEFEGKKIWLITDTHFHHKQIYEFENRPRNFKELVMENWSKQVGPDDIVIHLGDVIFSRAGELGGIIAWLPGYKILTKGNHDRQKHKWFETHGFDLSCDAIWINDIVFSHKPLEKEKMKNARYNIHGHFHRSSRGPAQFPFYNPNVHLKLALEECDYKLIELNEFIEWRLNNKLEV